MLKARMLSARVDEIGGPELSDGSKSLILRSIDYVEFRFRKIDILVYGVFDSLHLLKQKSPRIGFWVILKNVLGQFSRGASGDWAIESRIKVLAPSEE